MIGRAVDQHEEAAMRWAIATVSMPGSLAEKLTAAAEAGFQGVEIFENDLTYFDGRPEDVRALAASLGLELIALQPFRDFEGLPEPARGKAFDRARRKFALMARLGTPLLLVCSSISPEAIDDMARVAADLHELGDLARTFGVSVGFEALAWGRHINDYRQAWEAVRRADHPHVGLILDSFHLLARRLPVDTIGQIPAEKIALVQTADAPGIEMDLLLLSRHHRCLPGQGDLPVAAMIKKLREIGYQGPVSHEIFSDDFRASSTRRIANDGMRSFLWLDEQVAGQPSVPVPAIGGIEFIEFADHPNEVALLVEVLHGLGFRRSHRHRSKRVELYRQGEVNLVLNLEEEGFAHAFYLLHGRSVAAIALRVDDAAGAATRAAAMLAKPFIGPIGEGELEIPAVRGVSGSLVYFLEQPDGRKSFLDVDFVPDPGPAPAADLGLLRIDHVAQVVPEADLASWVLYYRAILGLEPTAPTDLADPHGLIVSRAMANQDRTLRIALNASQAERSAAGRFLRQTAGAGAQPIAFDCRDIFAAAAALPARLRLPIPDNYYEDLAARFDLDDALVARMRELCVLYDRIGAGELFQVFTRSISGMFFEIVERRDYDRYGEPNAAVRLAAQAALDRSIAEELTALRG
jgi:4-hydroxyphenylpyruvate dioxygenase